MKKFALALLVMLPLFSLAAFAQGGGWTVGVGGEVGVPTGDFNTAYSAGFGGMGTVGYVVDPNFTVTGKVGFLSFSGKEITGTIGGVAYSVTPPSLTIIPILVGGRYYFMPPADMRVYGSVDLGMFNVNNNVGTKFGFSPALGAMFKAGDNMNVDVHANYTSVSTEGSSSSWIGVGIGLNWDLK